MRKESFGNEGGGRWHNSLVCCVKSRTLTPSKSLRVPMVVNKLECEVGKSSSKQYWKFWLIRSVYLEISVLTFWVRRSVCMRRAVTSKGNCNNHALKVSTTLFPWSLWPSQYIKDQNIMISWRTTEQLNYYEKSEQLMWLLLCPTERLQREEPSVQGDFLKVS